MFFDAGIANAGGGIILELNPAAVSETVLILFEVDTETINDVFGRAVLLDPGNYKI